MSTDANTPTIAIQVSRGLVVASIQVDLEDEVLERLRDDLLRRLHETNSHGVILEVSGLETLDTHEFAELRRIITMIKIMGAESVLVGLRPGVVFALIEAGADVDGLNTAIDLDAAHDFLRREEPGEAIAEGVAEAAAGESEEDGEAAPTPTPTSRVDG